MNFLRRRFSTNDLQGDIPDDSETAGFNFSIPKKGPSPSAPSSPSKSSVQGLTRSLFGAAGNIPQQKTSYNKDRCKTLLVIDGSHVDWQKYFRGRKVFGDWDIRVEQAEFAEINLAPYSDTGTVVDIQVMRSGTKVVRSFKPDFVLVRQHVRNATEDWKNIIVGLHYGGVPSINSIQSIFNFLDRPWIYAHLRQIERRLGRDKFPLIEQAYFPTYKDMVVIPRLPVVVKVGNAHSGIGAVKVDSSHDYQDITSVISITQCYCTTEPYIDSKYDLHIQKIGSNYRAFVRTSISGSWKVNTGSSMIEEIPVNDRFKLWIDVCSQMFGGLDVLAVQAIQGKDGHEYILEVCDSSMALLGESQEEDRQLIADLVLAKMEVYCKPVQTSIGKSTSRSSNGRVGDAERLVNSRPMAGPPGPSPRHDIAVTITMATTNNEKSNASQTARRPSGPSAETADAVTRELEEPEDTMKNLRKTFAGIFGDM